MFSATLLQQAESLLETFRTKNRHIILAESCTGGLLSALITEIPGASDVFLGSFVSYHNAAKASWLNVPEDLLHKHGAVSAEVAAAMAEGALARAEAMHASLKDQPIISLSITGIAGPKGGSPKGDLTDKPVGLVFFSIAQQQEKNQTHKMIFAGTRGEIRLSAAAFAVSLLQNAPCAQNET